MLHEREQRDPPPSGSVWPSGARLPSSLVHSWKTPIALAGAVFVLEVATALANFGLYDSRFGILDSADQSSWSHILATLAFAAGAVICAARAAGAPSRGWWALAAVLFFVLLVDNVTRLHDQVSFWPLVYAPVLAGLAVAIVRVAGHPRTAPWAYTGLGLLFASLVIHVFGPDVLRMAGSGPLGWGHEVKAAVKEGLEVAGWILIVPALVLTSAPPARVYFGRLT
jgi:hypothetical protein